jgi:hypothetical protein
MPLFGALPAKLKPPTANVPRTSGSLASIASTVFRMFCV